MLRWICHSFVIVFLTLISQLGGLAWIFALFFKRRVMAFVLAYAGLWAGAHFLAPHLGRVPIPCRASHALHTQSWLYCVLNRNYVVDEMALVLDDAALKMAQTYPGTQTLLLDGNFPFVLGFPLLPHLSHDDGKKADLAFYYTVDGSYQPGFTKSWVGYFAFEEGPSQCPKQWPTLRWNMRPLQNLWQKAELEPQRTAALIVQLASDARVGRLFLEPHLARRLGVEHPKVRFQGCRAARHDDHIHVEL